MGGIVAMFSEGRPVCSEHLERAVRSLGHRGPDDRQHWVDAARSIGLGHTRLGIIDVAGGRQPVTNEDETIRAVVDGEIYDHERLRDELSARGHRFRTRSDSEVLVHLYEEHGTACVEHLRGELAFVLYDARADLLIAARDRCGVKPLVYGRHGGVLFVASEAKALFAAGRPAEWDIESFLSTCVVGSPLEDRTSFAGIQRIPAGHLLIASRGHHRLVRYWDFDYPIDGALAPRSEAEDREMLAATLSEAVRLRLRADVPVACYLGGLDSCTVFGMAARHAPAPLPGFTVAFGHAVSEENALAHELAASSGAAYTAVPVRRRDLARDLEQVLYFAERPLSNIGSVLLYQLSRALRDAGIKVVLTGEGSDEIFAGYAHFRRDLMIASLAPAGPPQPGTTAQAPAGPRRMSLVAIHRALGFIPTWLQVVALSCHPLLDLLHPELAERLFRGEPFAGLVSGLATSRQLSGRHPVHRSMYLLLKSTFPGYTLSAGNDAIQMAHGVECRLPYLDHRVIELSTRLPIDRSLRTGVEKHLLREVARPVVSDAIYRRPKDRILAPELAIIETELLDELLHDVLRGPLLSATPFFDRGRVLALLDSLPQRDAANRSALNASLMLILSTCLMQQRFGIGQAQTR